MAISGIGGALFIGPYTTEGTQTAIKLIVNEYTLTKNHTTIDASTLDDFWDKNIPGTKNWTCSLTVQYDQSNVTLKSLALEAVGAEGPVVVNLLVSGETAGVKYYYGSGTVTSVSIPVQRGSVVTQNVEILGNGVMNVGNLAAAAAEVDE